MAGVGRGLPRLQWGPASEPFGAAQESLVTVEAVVIRADGTREDLGVVATNDPGGPGAVKHWTDEEDDYGE